jgi:hypothetical protein
MKTNHITILCWFIPIFLLLNCKKDEPNVDVQIHISPELLTLNEGETGKLYISVSPSVTTDFVINASPSFFADISPRKGKIKGETIELEITINSESMPDGIFYGFIEALTNNAGKAVAEIQYAVSPKPVAHISSQEIIFANDQDEREISISNTGTGFLNWNLESTVSWLSFAPESGTLGMGESKIVKVTVNRTGIAPGELTTTITLSSNSIEANPSLNFAMQVSEKIEFHISVDEVLIGYLQQSNTFTIQNKGNITSTWTIDNNDVFLTFTPNSGTLLPEQSVQITVVVDRTNLLSQTYFSTARINDIQGYHKDLEIMTRNFIEEKWLFNGTVLDAEYNRARDILIICTTSPRQLLKFDFATQSVDALNFMPSPKAVSVSQDGNYAAVGHDGSFSYVNLNTMQVEQSYPVTINVFEIILAPNDWVYVFPSQGTSERIRCVDLSSGEESISTGQPISSNTLARLHSSGLCIYGLANNHYIEKYDLSIGTAHKLNQSSNQLSMGIWVSDNGLRIIGANRKVLRTSQNLSLDLTYNGSLEGDYNIMALDHSSQANRIYAVFRSLQSVSSPPSNIVRKYEDEYLTYINETTLPGFVLPGADGSGELLESEGHFGFFNSDGSKFHVVVKARAGSGTTNDWAIATINVD